MFMCILAYPVIRRGSFGPKPSHIPPGNQIVGLGAPIYLRKGNIAVITCLAAGKDPVDFKWYRNGSPFTFEGPQHYVAVWNPTNGDIYNCTATNRFGFDTAKSTIYIGGKWFMNIQYACIIIYVCTYICPFTLHIRTLGVKNS